MPLGLVIDSPSDPTSSDEWAVISSDGSGNWVVQNTIVASLDFVNTISASYDYSVDFTVGGQSPSIGDYYTPGTDTFAPPPSPPPNWSAIVEADFDQIVTDLGQLLSDAGNLDPTDLSNAFGNATTDCSGGYTANESALMTAIYNYIAGGG